MLVSDGVLTKSAYPYPLEYVAARWAAPGGLGDPLAWGSYGAIYRAQLWVAVVINKRAGMLAQLPLKVYSRGPNNDRVDARDTPYGRLLARPNRALDPVTFWTWTSCTWDIYGEAVWFKERDRGGRPISLVPLHPTRLTRETDGTWTYRLGSQVREGIPRADLVIFSTYNPDDLGRGLSRLEPLRQTLENEHAARTATSSFWRRGARPAMALTHPSTLGSDAQARLKAQFDAIAAGAANTGATVVLEEGMTPVPMTLTAEDAQYIETRKLNREEVVAAYDMPPPAVHILDHATFSNITEQFRSVYRDTMTPVLRSFEAVLDHDLRAPDFSEGLYAEFLMDEVLRGDFEARSQAYAAADYMTIAEKRARENLPYIDGTDVIVINAASIPLDQLEETTAARTASVLPTTRSLFGRISRASSPGQVPDDTFHDHPAALAILRAAKVTGADLPSLKRGLLALERGPSDDDEDR